MFQQLWHSCLLMCSIAYGIFVMMGDGPCEKSLNAASPIAIATKIAIYPHFWSPEQRASIQSGGNSAQLWLSGLVRDTFYDKSLVCKGATSEPTPNAPLPIQADPNAPSYVPPPSANPAGLPDLPKELR